jgi:hypothetical protein
MLENQGSAETTGPYSEDDLYQKKDVIRSIEKTFSVSSCSSNPIACCQGDNVEKEQSPDDMMR